MKVLLNGEAASLPKDAVTSVPGYDPRYDRKYEIEVLYYDAKDFLIVNKP